MSMATWPGRKKELLHPHTPHRHTVQEQRHGTNAVIGIFSDRRVPHVQHVTSFLNPYNKRKTPFDLISCFFVIAMRHSQRPFIYMVAVSLCILLMGAYGAYGALEGKSSKGLTDVSSSSASTTGQQVQGQCDTCKNVVDDLESKLNDPALQDTVVQFVLTTICPMLPADAAKTCSQEARVVVAQMVASIQQTLTPDVVCNYMGMCATNPMIQYMSGLMDQLKSMGNDGGVFGQQGACVLCGTIMDSVRNGLVKNNVDQESVNSFFDGIVQSCGASQQECQNLVNELRNFVIRVLEDINQNAMCGFIGVCGGEMGTNDAMNSFMEQLKQLFQKLVSMEVPLQPSPEDCATCEDVVAQAAAIVQNPDNQQRAFDLIKQGCSILSSFEQQCDDAVDEYGPMVMQLIVSYLQPQELCAELGYCDAIAAF